MTRCVICERRLWPWSGIITWHGTASRNRTVPVHKTCGLSAAAEWRRGLNFLRTPEWEET